jgi:3-dehydroquinate synthase
MFEYTKLNIAKAKKLDKEVVRKLVTDSVIIKSNIVNADETEKGERKKLNFGHTIGHAIEKHYKITHGEAISIGMVAAGRMALKRNLISESDFMEIKTILTNFGLPTEFKYDKKLIFEAILMDKKRESDSIHFILLNRIGNAVVEKISIYDLKKEIDDLC